MPQNNKVFYMNLAERGSHAPTARFDTFSAAKAEADRLARKTGVPIYTLRRVAVTEIVASPTATTTFGDNLE